MSIKLLWAISTVGTGHVFRNLDITEELSGLLGPLDITFVSGSAAARVLQQETGSCLNLLPPVDVPVRDGWLDMLGLGRGWLTCDQQAYKVAKDLMPELRPDIVLADEVPSFALAAKDHQLPAIYLTDFLFVDFVRPYWRSKLFNLLLAVAGWKLSAEVRRTYEKMDLMLYLNDPEDLSPIWRRWATERCFIAGPVARERQPETLDRQTARQRLKLSPGQKLIVVTIGGSDSGLYLAQMAAQALPYIRQQAPETRMLIVLGPAIDPDTAGIAMVEGLEVRGYERDLVSYLAASDLVICNAGHSTLMEIALRAKAPTITSPIGCHWEQEAIAKAALRQGYAHKIDRAHLSATKLAEAAIRILNDENLSRRMIAAARAIPDPAGATRAAQRIADFANSLNIICQ